MFKMLSFNKFYSINIKNMFNIFFLKLLIKRLALEDTNVGVY